MDTWLAAFEKRTIASIFFNHPAHKILKEVEFTKRTIRDASDSKSGIRQSKLENGTTPHEASTNHLTANPMRSSVEEKRARGTGGHLSTNPQRGIPMGNIQDRSALDELENWRQKEQGMEPRLLQQANDPINPIGAGSQQTEPAARSEKLQGVEGPVGIVRGGRRVTASVAREFLMDRARQILGRKATPPGKGLQDLWNSISSGGRPNKRTRSKRC